MAMKKLDIIEAIHEGTRAANKKYEKWTRGWWLYDSGVEGLLVVGIAEAVNKRQNKAESLLMEASYRDIAELSGSKRKRWPPASMHNKGDRADIVLFNRSDLPICVIEAKRFWDSTNCLKDLKRIESLVHTCSHQQGGSLRRGFLALMLQVSEETRSQSLEMGIEKRLKRIRQTVDEHFGKNERINVSYHISESWAWPEKYQKLYDSGAYQGASLCIGISSRNLAK